MSHPRPGREDTGPRSLQAILAPLPLEEFRKSYSGTLPLHLSGSAGRFRHLLDWEGLARLLETHPLEPPRLKIVRAGKTIPKERYLRHLGEMVRVDGGALSMLLDEGATMIINVVDDLIPAIADLADEVGESLGGRPAVNLYATWRSEHGFNPHSDFHDVLVLQLAGRKQWSIHQPTRVDPLRGDLAEPPPPDAEPHCVETLEDGDLLYLPRGWIHAPVPAGEPSLHLTISVTYPTGAGYLEWLTGQLKADPRVRASIPQDADERAAWREQLANIVADTMSGDSLDRYLVHKEAQRTARPHFSFPDFGRVPPSEWNEATTLRPASNHRFMVEASADGSAVLSAAGHSLLCSRAVADALGRLTSTKAIPLGDLETGLEQSDVTQLRQLLGLLSKFGLLAAERG